MSTFPPGTRVLAKHKHGWRFARVVELPSNADPQRIAVKFVGKTAQIVIPAKNVKLASRPNDAIDLTNDIDEHTPSNSAQIHRTTSLPAAISDPYSQGPHRLSAASPSPAHSTDGPFPPPSCSDQSRHILHVQQSNPVVPQQCTPQNAKQSSRNWLLAAQHSTQPHPNLAAAQSKPHFNSAQRQPQVVQDPSFPAAQYPPQSRGNPTFPQWDTFPEHPTDEKPALSSQAGCEENFDHIAENVHAPSFQFTPIRTDAKFSQALSPTVPTGSLARGQVPLKPVPSQLEASIRASSPLISLRGGVRTRNPERHPLRSVDEHVRDPHSSIAQDLPRVPRHPQSSFDDDVPIPRNGTSRRFLSNPVVQGAADIGGETRLYPTSKRPRIRYDQIAGDQMPPSPQTQFNMRGLSRRLAKRDWEQGRYHVENRHKKFVVPSLPYQCLLQRGNGRVTIAPGFASPKAFAASSEKTFDKETKFLEEIFTELSAKIRDLRVDTDDTLLGHMPSKRSSLPVRGSGRRKSHPKKWSRPHYGKNCVRRVSSEIVVSQAGVESGSLEGDVATSGDGTPQSGSGAHENTKECPIPRLYGCFCQDEFGEHRSVRNDRYSIQCCLCALWSHMRCIGFEPAEIKALRTRNAKGLEKYICAQCVEEHLEFETITSVLQRPLFDKVFRTGKKWTSSVNTVSAVMLGRSTIETDRLLQFGVVDDRGGNGSAWIRKPLAKDEISARRNNFEELREGFANASVGLRERILFDEQLGDQQYHPGDLD